MQLPSPSLPATTSVVNTKVIACFMHVFVLFRSTLWSLRIKQIDISITLTVLPPAIKLPTAEVLIRAFVIIWINDLILIEMLQRRYDSPHGYHIKPVIVNVINK